MSSAAPAIPLFGDAYIADTRHLSLEEHGAYLNLMMIAWRSEDCSLPNDDARLARMLGVTAKKWAGLKPTVMDFWTLDSDRWSQKRLTKERRYVAKKSEQNAEAANARWKAKSLETKGAPHANAPPMQSERNAPPPSPTQEIEEEETAAQSVRAARQPVALAIEVWNAVAKDVGWPLSQRPSHKRQKAVAARLRDHGLDAWKAAIARARASPYLSSTDPPTWFTIDWLAKDENFPKVTEGNYDRRRSDTRSCPTADAWNSLNPSADAAF